MLCSPNDFQGDENSDTANNGQSPRRRLPDPGQGKLIKELTQKMESETRERLQVDLLFLVLSFPLPKCRPPTDPGRSSQS